jgi:hypothetical protein
VVIALGPDSLLARRMSQGKTDGLLMPIARTLPTNGNGQVPDIGR